MALDLPTYVSPYLAAGRNIVGSAAAFAAGVGVHSIGDVSTDNVVTGFNHIFNGLNELAVGVGILTPIAAAAWAFVSGLLKHQVAAVKAAAPKELAQAVQQVAPATLVQAAAEVPGVARIIASPALAQATPSEKVVAAA